MFGLLAVTLSATENSPLQVGNVWEYLYTEGLYRNSTITIRLQDSTTLNDSTSIFIFTIRDSCRWTRQDTITLQEYNVTTDSLVTDSVICTNGIYTSNAGVRNRVIYEDACTEEFEGFGYCRITYYYSEDNPADTFRLIASDNGMTMWGGMTKRYISNKRYGLMYNQTIFNSLGTFITETTLLSFNGSSVTVPDLDSMKTGVAGIKKNKTIPTTAIHHHGLIGIKPGDRSVVNSHLNIAGKKCSAQTPGIVIR